MSSVPGAPLPSVGPTPPPSNPWTRFAGVGGALATVIGILVVLAGSLQGNYTTASPVPMILGSALLGIGVLLLACALVLAGVDWSLAHRRVGAEHEAQRTL